MVVPHDKRCVSGGLDAPYGVLQGWSLPQLDLCKELDPASHHLLMNVLLLGNSPLGLNELDPLLVEVPDPVLSLEAGLLLLPQQFGLEFLHQLVSDQLRVLGLLVQDRVHQQ